jgi:uncharacterized membrane protein YdbT with pleckstrin-like domain
MGAEPSDVTSAPFRISTFKSLRHGRPFIPRPRRAKNHSAIQSFGLENSAVPDLTIQPTAKFLKAGTILAAMVFLGLEIAYLAEWQDDVGRWVMVVPPLILLWPLARWMRRNFSKATMTGDRLRYETGFTSKSTRTIQLSKVQDVRVDQRMSQRMFGVGDIAIETAGEASRLTLHNVDNPQALADEILTRAQHGPHGQAVI